MRSLYYNRQGEPIDVEQFGILHATDFRVAETTIGPLWVSTVWLGIDHSFVVEEPHLPVIFETMIFPSGETYWEHGRYDDSHLHVELRELVDQCWRYSTEQQAIAGHDEICVETRVLIANIEMAEQVMHEAIMRESEQ